MIRAIPAIVALFVQSAAFASAQAAPCADVEYAQAIIAKGFAGVTTRKDPPLEYLTKPLFGDDSCMVSRPRAFSTAYRITCILFDGAGTPKDPSSRELFGRLSKTMNACLTQHNAFDNRANEEASDEILDRSYFRSYDGRETWSLTLSDKHDPKVEQTVESETDAETGQKQTSLPGFLQNVLAAQACETFGKMETAARTNFAGVETKSAGGQSTLTKPLDGATECLVGRNPYLDQNAVACNWLKLDDPSHAKWADDIQAIRLQGARSCRKGWSETKTAFGVAFNGPNGEKLLLETRSGDAGSVTSIELTIPNASKPAATVVGPPGLNQSVLAKAAKAHAAKTNISATPDGEKNHCAPYKYMHELAEKNFAGASTHKFNEIELLSRPPVPNAQCVVRRPSAGNPYASIICAASQYGVGGSTWAMAEFDRHVKLVQDCRVAVKAVTASAQARYAAGGQASFVTDDKSESWVAGYGKRDDTWYFDLGVSTVAR